MREATRWNWTPMGMKVDPDGVFIDGVPYDALRERVAKLEGTLNMLLTCVELDNPTAPPGERTYSLREYVHEAFTAACALMEGKADSNA